MGRNYQRRRFSSAPRGGWGESGCAVWAVLGLGTLGWVVKTAAEVIL